MARATGDAIARGAIPRHVREEVRGGLLRPFGVAASEGALRGACGQLLASEADVVHAAKAVARHLARIGTSTVVISFSAGVILY